MKFLLIAKPKPLPANISRKLYGCLVEQSLILLQKLWGEGKLLSLWMIKTGGTAAVIQAYSLAELEENLKHYPLYQFFTWEIERLIDASVLRPLTRGQVLSL